MTIPASIFTALTSLQTQVQQAQPLNNATRPTITAMQLNAANLIVSVQAQLVLSSLLDTFTAAVDAPTIISGVLSVLGAANDQSELATMRGIVGRVSTNLDRLV